MSNTLAIAAVTNTLRTLIDRGLRDGTAVTIFPPDRARGNLTGRQVNLFLYQVALNAAWRNMDLPQQNRSGESASPPLPLNLYYLLTVYAADGDSESSSQALLGTVMSVLHDHPVLGRDEIQRALAGNDLYAQVERIRLTFQPLSLDDIFKLWSGYQTPYRLSVAYEATVVLIESTRASKTPLPVLTFGPGDTGPVAQADLTSPFPALDGRITPPVDITPGTVITLTGIHLASLAPVRLRFRAAGQTTVIEANAEAGATDTQVQVRVPANLSVGIYTLAAVVTTANADASGGQEERFTNEVPLAVAPVIASIAPANPIAIDAQGNVTVTVASSASIGPDQRVSLLLGDREVRSAPRTAAQTNLAFLVKQAVAGSYRARLRVDGVDSPLIDWSKTPPVFKAPIVEVGP
ncbi:MAG TPA: DUF4255 domain-containing protein [Isosphaeraceae bacterium]|nr:DUF4255 domain-containing protein [Isosphaeraceae bacterium]